uniref:Pleckstriny domain-containing family G member 1 n=1 Tax=Apis cerana TaxID=7461 RepID=V9IEF2_APICE
MNKNSIDHLQNLSKEYAADCEVRENKTEGSKAIEAALAAMTDIAKHINAMKRRHEHAVRVQEIQSLLYGWPGPDLTTSGELVAEGRFRMRGAKAPRHVFLFDRMLLLTKKKEMGF